MRNGRRQNRGSHSHNRHLKDIADLTPLPSLSLSHQPKPPRHIVNVAAAFAGAPVRCIKFAAAFSGAPRFRAHSGSSPIQYRQAIGLVIRTQTRCVPHVVEGGGGERVRGNCACVPLQPLHCPYRVSAPSTRMSADGEVRATSRCERNRSLLSRGACAQRRRMCATAALVLKAHARI